MSKLIIGLIITSLMTLPGISQIVLKIDTTLTTCLPNTQLREVMRLNEVRKVQVKELVLVKEQAGILEERVIVKDSIITMHEKKDLTNTLMVAKYDSSITNLTSQITIHKDINAGLKKELKIANRKRILNKIFYGGIAAVALVLLAIK